MTRVLVVADSVIARAGLESLLARTETLKVVGNVAGGSDLPRQASELHPDVVLLELDQHDTDPLPLLRDLATHLPDTAIVVLAGDERDGWTMEALRAGVRAVMPRDATQAEIIAAVEAAAAGLIVLPASSVDAALPLAGSTSPARTRTGEQQALTPREIEILNLLAEGLGNKAIAPRLGISEHTVKFHLASIFTKLGVSTRTEAVTMGARLGVILL